VVERNELRRRLAGRLHRMYAGEVSAYARLYALVLEENRDLLRERGDDRADDPGCLEGLSAPRHGAIRLGHPRELALLARLFAQYGMEPVDFYDLVPAGLPVMSTAFRPVGVSAIEVAPLRMFCSLLRPELIPDETVRAGVDSALSSREILSPELVAIVERAERDGGVGEDCAEAFLEHSVNVFRWQGRATVDRSVYDSFCAAHKLIADIAAFPGPHINHLTPSALDIDRVQSAMAAWGFNAKEVIEGPPRRACPILLRQTACKAEAEAVVFPSVAGKATGGEHAARFGEVEQRGVALTPAGRELYDRCLAGRQDRAHGDAASAFAAFPDSQEELIARNLAYFRFDRARGASLTGLSACDLNDPAARAEAVCARLLIATPVRYEDFLPVSAAGIFRSNLDGAKGGAYAETSSKAEFEGYLGRAVISSDDLYARQQHDSLSRAGVAGTDG